MSDKALQLPAAQTPLGDQLDGELLTVGVPVVRQRVQNCGAGEGATDIQEGGSGAIAIDAYGLGVRPIRARSTLQTFETAVVLNVTTQRLSTLEFDCGPYDEAILYLDAVIAASPTALNVAFEFADLFVSPTSTDWHIDLANRVRITDFTEQRRALILPAAGRIVRTRLDGEGTDGSNTITVTLTAEFYTK